MKPDQDGAGGSEVAARTITQDDSAPPAEFDIELAEIRVADLRRYSILGEIGHGGLGRVLAAEDRTLKRRIAIKELRSPGQRQARFLREALITARLQHPSIVPLYELGQWENGEPYYAMRLVSGKSLSELIGLASSLDERLALLPNMIAVADAIAYAHSERIVHRDLKPENVLVGEFGEAVVIDWGLAKHLDEVAEPDASSGRTSDRPGPLTLAGEVLGTPVYMAPEQAKGEDLDERVDVYALGAMLYELLTGAWPHTGASNAQVIARLVRGDPITPVAEKQPGVPADLAAIVNKAMTYDRAQRYPNAATLAADLRRFQTGQLVAAHHYTRRTLVKRWLRRHRALATLAMITFVGLMVGLVVLYNANLRSEQAGKRADAAANQARDALVTANQRLIQLYREQGRTDVLAGREPRGLANLAQAFALGADDFDLRMLVARARPAVDPRIANLVGHNKTVTSCVFDATGHKVLSSSEDGTVRMWDTAGVAMRTIAGPEPLRSVRSVPGPVDRVFVVGAKRGYVLDGVTGHILVAMPAHALDEVRVDVSSDGRYAVTGSRDGVAYVSDLSSGSLVATLHHETAILTVAISPDSKLIVTAGHGPRVRVWDRYGQLLWERAIHPRNVWIVWFSPDGRRLVAGGGNGDPVVTVFDAATGAVERELVGHTDIVSRVRFNASGTRVFTSSLDGTAKMWNAHTGALLRTFRGGEGNVGLVGVPDDGHRLITSDQDGSVHVWETDSGVAIAKISAQAVGITAIEAPPAGDVIVTCGLDEMALWRPRTMPMVATLSNTSGVFSARFDRHHHVVTCASDGTVGIWDAAGRSLRTVRPLGPSPEGCNAAPDPAGRRVAVAGAADHTARILDLVAPETASVVLGGHTARVTSIDFGDGDRVVTGSEDGTVRLWSARDGTAVRTIEQRGTHIAAVALSRDGRRIATAVETAAYVFDADTGALLATLGPHRDNVSSVTFSADGRLIVTASWDGAARVFDATRGALLQQLDFPSIPLAHASLSADGRAVVTAGFGTNVRVWSVANRRVVAELVGHDGNYVPWVEYAPDGHQFVSAGMDGRVRVWELAPDARPSREIVGWIACHAGMHFENGDLVPGSAPGCVP